MPKFQYIVCGPNGLKGQYTLEVHRAGCPDLAQPKYRYVDLEPVHAETPLAAALDMFLRITPRPMPRPRPKFFPCCSQAATVTP